MKSNLQRADQRGSHVAPIILGESGKLAYWGILYRNYDYDNFMKRPEEYKTLTVEKSGGYKYCPYCSAQLPDPNSSAFIDLAHKIDSYDCTKDRGLTSRCTGADYV